jgi:hypothetical protein
MEYTLFKIELKENDHYRINHNESLTFGYWSLLQGNAKLVYQNKFIQLHIMNTI